ncbi:hypothetical protein [Nocardiopsis aegyptia]|uniref:Uncharacterized protein n=1 Tax=Nocardiopsis aegyptia TaxID=220378 RepID=A0A7Z0JAR1_9ACTN|nr:hypothetical protein [Nocardiopsis aegyptia]NYJ34680.1 hypothetical protein [Nocardiopsis aegyptia]
MATHVRAHAVPGRIPAAELRPRRLWYGVGAAVLAVSVIVGVAGFAVMLTRLLAAPDFVAEVRGPGEAVFTVDEDFGELGLYGSPVDWAKASCSVIAPSGRELDFDFPPYRWNWESGTENWNLTGAVVLTETGRHTLVCDGGDDTVYAVGDLGADGEGFTSNLLGALAWVVLVPSAGLALGGAVMLVTGARRNAHHRRLLAERTPPLGHT